MTDASTSRAEPPVTMEAAPRSRRRVGILGGTFNPVHVGHLMLGEAAYEQFALDEVQFMPAGRPPHKLHREGATDVQRVEMLRRAIADNPHFVLNLREMQSSEVSYTYRTLEAMRSALPDTDFYFIMGADSLVAFDTWREPGRIARAAHLVVASRRGSADTDLAALLANKQAFYGGHFHLLDTPQLEIASHTLREKRAAGQSIRYYVPEAVRAYIETEHIYEASRESTMAKEKSEWAVLEKKLQGVMTENRYRHTLGVTYTACALAMAHGADLYAARMGGLLHDCAKCISNSEKIDICKKKRIPVTDFELAHPVLLHAKLGAYLAHTTYGCEDQAVLDAITWHTTGKPNMSTLEKIIFVADYIEPNRTKQPRLAEIRRAAFEDLDLATYMILKDTVDYLSDNPKSMDKTTLDAYKYYKTLTEEDE